MTLEELINELEALLKNDAETDANTFAFEKDNEVYYSIDSLSVDSDGDVVIELGD